MKRFLLLSLFMLIGLVSGNLISQPKDRVVDKVVNVGKDNLIKFANNFIFDENYVWKTVERVSDVEKVMLKSGFDTAFPDFFDLATEHLVAHHQEFPGVGGLEHIYNYLDLDNFNLLEKIPLVKSEIEKLNKKIMGLEKDIENARQDLTDCRSLVISKESENENLKTDIGNLNNRMKSLEEEKGNLVEERNNLKSLKESFEKDLKEVRELKDKTESEKNKLQSQLGVCQNESAEGLKALKEKDLKLTSCLEEKEKGGKLSQQQIESFFGGDGSLRSLFEFEKELDDRIYKFHGFELKLYELDKSIDPVTYRVCFTTDKVCQQQIADYNKKLAEIERTLKEFLGKDFTSNWIEEVSDTFDNISNRLRENYKLLDKKGEFPQFLADMINRLKEKKIQRLKDYIQMFNSLSFTPFCMERGEENCIQIPCTPFLILGVEKDPIYERDPNSAFCRITDDAKFLFVGQK